MKITGLGIILLIIAIICLAYSYYVELFIEPLSLERSSKGFFRVLGLLALVWVPIIGLEGKGRLSKVPDTDSEEASHEEADNGDEEADYVTSETEGSPDNGYKCTIMSRKYGTIWGFGQTAEDAEEDAHKQYEHYKSKW